MGLHVLFELLPYLSILFSGYEDPSANTSISLHPYRFTNAHATPSKPPHISAHHPSEMRTSTLSLPLVLLLSTFATAAPLPAPAAIAVPASSSYLARIMSRQNDLDGVVTQVGDTIEGVGNDIGNGDGNGNSITVSPPVVKAIGNQAGCGVDTEVRVHIDHYMMSVSRTQKLR